jgi:phosphonate ABC transporter, permease protein PhnE
MKKKNNENITTSENSNEKKKSWWDKFLSVMHFKSYNEFESPDDAYKKRPRLWIYDIILVLIFVGILVYFAVDVDFMGNITFNETRLGELWNGFINPNWSFFFGYGNFHFNESVIYKIIETFAIAFIGTTISSILSIPFGFLASRKIIGRYSTISEFVLIVIRTFPEILFGLIMVKVVGFGSFAGITVLSIHSIGMIGKMYSEQLDVIKDQPLEALDACGASTMSRIKLGVVPQIAPNFLSVILYRFDLNVRTASLLGLVGAGGIGYDIWVYSQFGTWSMLTPLLYGVVILIICVDVVSSLLRKKLI